jgi:DNA-binding transcriptional regulator YiaG
MTMALAANELSRPAADVPYVMRLPGQCAVAVNIPAQWVVHDRTGAIGFRPPAVRLLDRLRALYARIEQPPTPGFILTLRQAMRLTQEQFGRRLGVGKMTVSRWERGAMHPGQEAVRSLTKLRGAALRRGILVDGER